MKSPGAVVRLSLVSPVLARTVLASAALVTAMAGCASMTSDAIAAATLPVPPVAGASGKALTAAYAAAGTALAHGDATGAVPKLQEGNSAISAFSTASARCS